MPRFSIVLPTLRRSDILGGCLATLLHQDFDDYEIVVQNNGRDPATEAVVRDLGDDRVRHCYSDSVVTMADNWEAGIANAHGEFIAIVGDGDGVFPDCCRIAAEVLDHTDVEIVSWLPFSYFWPEFTRPATRNRLIAKVDFNLRADIVQTDGALHRVYSFESELFQLPSIYNAFVGRPALQRAIDANGRYFLSPFPDVSSGIVNLASVTRFARVSRALSVVGFSRHSSMGNMFLAKQHAFPEAVERDFGLDCTDPRLVAAENMQIFIANELLLNLRQPLLREHRVEMDFHRLLEWMAVTINDRPQSYDKTLAAMEAIAGRHGIDLSDIVIPSPVAETEHRVLCSAEPVDSNKVRFVLDGDALGLHNGADAARTLQQFIPRLPLGTAIAIKDWEPDCGKLRRGQAMTFRRLGNGVAALASGWAAPEEWGAWSQAKRASLHLMVDSEVEGDVYLALSYRAFVHHAMKPDLCVACRVLGTEVAAWTCGEANATGVQHITIPAHLISPRTAISLEFQIANAYSPAEAGFGSDTRLLGIGVESLKLLDPPEPTRGRSALSFTLR